jgi:FdrA protein
MYQRKSKICLAKSLTRNWPRKNRKTGKNSMRITRNIVRKNFFRDSVQMMLLSQELKKEEGVVDAAIVMGTELNKDTLLRCGLLTVEGANAEESDTLISLTCKDESSLARAAERAESLLVQNPTTTKGDYYSTVEDALSSFIGANLAALSIPGKHVKSLATRLIDRGLHVFLFSDHVPLEDEIALKRLASQNKVLFMGPEAGTSIINGTVLGFGNRIRPGNVGIIGASGTGIQESTTLLHSYGSGITHAIGVGGRDMKKQVGGLMTLQTVTAFEEDPRTQTVLIVSKPVERDVREKIVDAIKSLSKKNYVLCLIGDKEQLHDTPQIQFARSIQSAVLKTMKAFDRVKYKAALQKCKSDAESTIAFTRALSSSLSSRQRYIRGLFAGGTLCYESSAILEDIVGRIHSNLTSEREYHVDGNEKSGRYHSLIDFGDEEFTAARPHPIIDPSIRLSRLLKEANDPSVAVIIMDIIEGYSVSDKNIEQHAEAISKAVALAGKQNRTLSVFTYICGTEDDVSKSELQTLQDSGAEVFTSNALMSIAAGMIVKKDIPNIRLNRIMRDYLAEEIV